MFRSLLETFVRRSLFSCPSSSCQFSDVMWQEIGRMCGSVCSCLAVPVHHISSFCFHCFNSYNWLWISFTLGWDNVRVANEKEYENSFRGQRWRSYVTNLRPLLAFTTGHIPTELHRFLIIVVFKIFWGQTDTQTDRHRRKQCLITACAQVMIGYGLCAECGVESYSLKVLQWW